MLFGYSILFASIFSVALTFDLFGLPKHLTAPQIKHNARTNLFHTTLTMKQKWNHFNPSDDRTFDMYYSLSDQYFNGSGPIFISITEVAMSPWEIYDGFLRDMAREFSGLMIVAEVRFSGISWPSTNLTMDILEYMTIEQRLEDIASLIKHLKKDKAYAGSKVLITGCGLSANLATWMRMVHPELVDVTVASSAPVNVKPDFREYVNDLSQNIAAEHGTVCSDAIRDGFLEARQLVEKNDTKTFKERFRLCETQSFAYDDISAFFNGYYNAFNLFELNYRGCDILLEAPGTPLQKVSHYIKEIFFPDLECLETVRFNDLVEALDPNNENEEESVIARSMYYYFCNHIGLQVVSDTKEMLFADSIPIELFTKNICSRAIDESLDEATVLSNIANTNKKYGGLTPNVTRVISVHGEISPIRLIGITQDLNADSPAIIIEGEDSCSDIISDNWTTPAVKEAHKKVIMYIRKWIAE